MPEPTAKHLSNKEVEAKAVDIVRKYFDKRGKTLSKPKPLQDGYDYDVDSLAIEIKGFTAPDSDEKWFNLSRLAQKGYDLAKERTDSYELHLIQFKTKDLNEYTHWIVKGQNVSKVYTYPRVAWEATGSVKDNIIQYAEKVAD